jgi:hypothetical protein
MTVAVETTLSLNGEGLGYEETVLVIEDGHEIMTAACPARWWWREELLFRKEANRKRSTQGDPTPGTDTG